MYARTPARRRRGLGDLSPGIIGTSDFRDALNLLINYSGCPAAHAYCQEAAQAWSAFVVAQNPLPAAQRQAVTVDNIIAWSMQQYAPSAPAPQLPAPPVAPPPAAQPPAAPPPAATPPVPPPDLPHGMTSDSSATPGLLAQAQSFAQSQLMGVPLWMVAVAGAAIFWWKDHR